MKNSLLLIFVIFILAIISNLDPVREMLSPYINTLANLAAAGGLVALFFQFKRERDLNEADFILRINQDFMTNESISRIYKLLEQSKADEQKENPFKPEDLIDMANYLTYFEPFYSLIDRKIIKIHSLDSVLAYRFFLATNNRFMQQMLLCAKNKEIAWESTYKLYDHWIRYRNRKNVGIWQSDHALSKQECYLKVVDL